MWARLKVLAEKAGKSPEVYGRELRRGGFVTKRSQFGRLVLVGEDGKPVLETSTNQHKTSTEPTQTSTNQHEPAPHHLIRVSDDVHAGLFALAGELEVKRKRKASVDDALEELLQDAEPVVEGRKETT